MQNMQIIYVFQCKKIYKVKAVLSELVRRVQFKRDSYQPPVELSNKLIRSKNSPRYFLKTSKRNVLFILLFIFISEID